LIEEIPVKDCLVPGFDNQVGRERLAPPIAILETDCRYRVAVGRGHEFPSAALSTDRDVFVSFRALPNRELDQRSGHGVADPTQIALRKGVKPGCLETGIETNPHRHRPDSS